MAGFMTKVSFAPKVAVLMKATSDNMTPTAGYLYDEITQITYESLEYCDYMAEFLVDRLNKKSLHVKGKVLVVMKRVLEKGHDEFAKCLRRKDSGIRECEVINGPPDPLHGDTFYVNIRMNAASVLELLFNVDKKKAISPPSSNQTSYSGGKKMEGYGNTGNQTQESGMIKEVYGNLKDAFQNLVTHSLPSSGSTARTENQYTTFESDSRSNIEKPSNTIYNFFDTPISTSTQSSHSTQLLSQSGGPKYTWLAKTSTSKSNERMETQTQKVSQKAIDADMYETEKRLVEEISAIQGIRPQPSKRDVDTLIKRCHTLDCAVVVDQVNAKLSESDTRIQLRVMWVIEGMLESSLPDIQVLIENACAEKLEELKTSSHTPVRNKALKVLASLHRKDVMPNVASQAVSQPNVASFNDDLFGTMDLQQNTQRAFPTPVASTMKTNTSQDILGFDFPSQPAHHQTNSANTPFDFDPFEQLSSSSTSSQSNAMVPSASLSQQPIGSKETQPSFSVILPKSSTTSEQNIASFSFDQPPGVQQTVTNKSNSSKTVSQISENDFFANFERPGVISSSKQPKTTLLDQNNLDPFGSLSSASNTPQVQQTTPIMLPPSNVNNLANTTTLRNTSTSLLPTTSASSATSFDFVGASQPSSSTGLDSLNFDDFKLGNSNATSFGKSRGTGNVMSPQKPAQNSFNTSNASMFQSSMQPNLSSMNTGQHTGSMFSANQQLGNLSANQHNTAMFSANQQAMFSANPQQLGNFSANQQKHGMFNANQQAMFSTNQQQQQPRYPTNMNMGNKQTPSVLNNFQQPGMQNFSNIYRQNQPAMTMGMRQQPYMNQQQQQQSSSNLNFLRTNSTQNNRANDSFDFVQDAMRASKK